MLKEMNKLIADLNVLGVKLHTYHYNVVGNSFYATHVFLEGQYDATNDFIDEVAEVLKMSNEYPIGTIKEMLSVSTIKEVESKDYTAKEVLTDLISDYKMLIESCQAIKEQDLSLIAEDVLDAIESALCKQVWFMSATIK